MNELHTSLPLTPMLWVVETTLPSHATAAVLAETAIQTHLAACAQISSAVTSLYHWQDKYENSMEVKLTFKATETTLHNLLHHIESQRPYDTPEILWFATHTTARYHQWATLQHNSKVVA